MPVEVKEMKEARRNLTRFLKEFKGCAKTKCSRAHLRTYVKGQLSDLPRKSVEPIALAAGVAPRTLQEFLSMHRWNEEAVRRRVQRLVMRDHADPNAIAVIDAEPRGFPTRSRTGRSGRSRWTSWIGLGPTEFASRI